MTLTSQTTEDTPSICPSWCISMPPSLATSLLFPNYFPSQWAIRSTPLQTWHPQVQQSVTSHAICLIARLSTHLPGLHCQYAQPPPLQTQMASWPYISMPCPGMYSLLTAAPHPYSWRAGNCLSPTIRSRHDVMTHNSKEASCPCSHIPVTSDNPKALTPIFSHNDLTITFTYNHQYHPPDPLGHQEVKPPSSHATVHIVANTPMPLLSAKEKHFTMSPGPHTKWQEVSQKQWSGHMVNE